MKWDLKQPCKNCPFGNTPDRITFAARERAEEIEETAYRNGFPCHLSATLDEDCEDAGFEFGPNTQHCAGALLMYLHEGSGGNVPFSNLPDREQERIEKRVNWAAPVFESVEEFLDANTTKRKKRRRA